MAPEVLAHAATKRIAGKEPCSVVRCPCGCVHVHIGAFTIRLGAGAFRAMATVIGEAAVLLADEPPSKRCH